MGGVYPGTFIRNAHPRTLICTDAHLHLKKDRYSDSALDARETFLHESANAGGLTQFTHLKGPFFTEYAIWVAPENGRARSPSRGGRLGFGALGLKSWEDMGRKYPPSAPRLQKRDPEIKSRYLVMRISSAQGRKTLDLR